jgi:hypothetical protein
MATGIKITKAEYGSGSTLVDVRAAVSSNIRNGELNLIVSPDSLGVQDPAPGQTKQLTVSYTINNGETNVKSAYDNEAIIIAAPSVTIASGLDINKAQYGYTGNMTDVTDAIRNYIDNGTINVKVSPSTMGIPDPNPNKQKVLQVEYKLNGSPNSQTIKDGETFSVSAPPAQNTPSGPGIGDTIGYSILWTLLYSLYFIGIVAAYKYGELFNKWVGYLFAGISFIPIAGFWFVCLFAMGYQYYAGYKMNLFENVIIPFKNVEIILPVIQ